MPPIERFGRVEDDARVRGVWMRPVETRWCAPVRLADGALGLCWVEVGWEPEDPLQRRASWAVFARGGQLLQDAFGAPGARPQQILAAVERALADAGIALDGRGGP